ncbi:CoA pyrophosphatase [Microbacterium sp. SYP-A9085]|uniref:NUDIX hydrolase n=1 Tax=Microbacterium sp. SYP-A9085 TaxID=2664454 RepID=UPI003464133F
MGATEVGAGDARTALARIGGPVVDWGRLPEQLTTLASGRRSAVLMLFGAADGSVGDHAVAPSDTAVLLLRRASGLRHHPGQIGFPGGGLEPVDVDPSAAAVREAVEETGVDPRGIELFAPLPELPLAVSNHLVTPVPAWWRHPSPVHAVDAAETEEVFFTSVGALLDPANRRSVERVRGMRIPRMPAFEVDGRLVWGFTAALLSGLFDTLGWAVPWDEDRVVEPGV